MSAINDFVTQARDNGISDDVTRQALEAQGWDKNNIEFAMAGIAVPAPAVTANTAPQPQAPIKSGPPSISPLMSALQHVLLWFFMIAASVSIFTITSSLLGNMSSDIKWALTAIAIVGLTFIPYAILFTLYLRKLKAQPDMVPGKVWSTITICFFSIGALGAAITLLIAAINNTNNSGNGTILGACIMLLLSVVILLTYIFAAFGLKLLKARKTVLMVSLPVIIAILGGLFTVYFINYGPAKADETTRTNLSATVENIREKTMKLNRLPTAQEATSLIAASGITYKKNSSTLYELCANFLTDSNDTSYYSSYLNSYPNSEQKHPANDSYISTSGFISKRGNQCFSLESGYLSNGYNKSTMVDAIPV